MKTLIVEDEFTTRLIMQKIMSEYGEVHIAVNGREATEAVRASIEQNEPYDFISLDVMMPEMNGQEALRAIRDMEVSAGIIHQKQSKIIMTTALGDGKTIMTAFKDQCNGYLIKPIDKSKLLKYLKDFDLI